MRGPVRLYARSTRPRSSGRYCFVRQRFAAWLRSRVQRLRATQPPIELFRRRAGFPRNGYHVNDRLGLGRRLRGNGSGVDPQQTGADEGEGKSVHNDFQLGMVLGHRVNPGNRIDAMVVRASHRTVNGRMAVRRVAAS